MLNKLISQKDDAVRELCVVMQMSAEQEQERASERAVRGERIAQHMERGLVSVLCHCCCL